MSRFLYYLPRVSGISSAMLVKCGLADRFRNVGPKLNYISAGVDNGPAGTGALAAYPTPSGQPITYDPGSQTWTDCGKFWIGLETGREPGPDDLHRTLGVAEDGCYVVRLGDGNDWTIPLIHRWDKESGRHVANLPKAILPVKGDRGGFHCVKQVRPEYRAVDELATRTFAAFVENKTVSMDELLADAAAIMAVNHRIGKEECAVLGLFDEQSAVRVLTLSIDLPRLQAEAAARQEDGLVWHEPKIEQEG